MTDREPALEVAVGERVLRFPAAWLRDNCACAECMDPGSGQKLKDVTEMPDGLVVAAAEETGESVVVTYGPDGHRSIFSRSWLVGHALDCCGDGDGRTEEADVTAFYAAYRRWAELLAQPERQLKLRLAPGDCLIFDNTRILHARTAFSVAGSSPGRHLQGCYADLDGLASTLAVLNRPSGRGQAAAS